MAGFSPASDQVFPFKILIPWSGSYIISVEPCVIPPHSLFVLYRVTVNFT